MKECKWIEKYCEIISKTPDYKNEDDITYTGTYIYNKSIAVDSNGKWNRHQTKNEDEIIRIKGGIPQIISKEDFQKVQAKMVSRKHKTASFKAKHDYLLSGKIKCGECASAYAGNARRPDKKNPLYISYNCTRKNHSNSCKNPGVRRDEIEELILNKLSDTVFNEKILPVILKEYNDYALSKNQEYLRVCDGLKLKLSETEKGIANIVEIVVTTGSVALTDKLKELEDTKVKLEQSIAEMNQRLDAMKVDENRIKSAFRKAKEMLRSGTLKNKKAIVEQYVKQVTVFKDRIEIEHNISDTYSFTETIKR